jgi:hypothetical protein
MIKLGFMSTFMLGTLYSAAVANGHQRKQKCVRREQSSFFVARWPNLTCD